jgi:hypothetical protein
MSQLFSFEMGSSGRASGRPEANRSLPDTPHRSEAEPEPG